MTPEDRLGRLLDRAPDSHQPAGDARTALQRRVEDRRRARLFRRMALAAVLVAALAILLPWLIVNRQPAAGRVRTIAPATTASVGTTTPTVPATTAPPTTIPPTTAPPPPTTAASPATTTTAPPTTTTVPPSSTAPPTSATTSTADGRLSLVAGPYGFLVPEGWQERPLTELGRTASYATFSSPSSGSTIEYEVSGGEPGTVYNADHAPDLTGGPTGGALSLAGCPVMSSTVVAVNEVAFRCSSSAPGMETNGAIIVEPFPQGWKGLRVTLPVADRATATAILDSFRP
ncbi:MAG: hypothetical protein J2O39_02500 [Acidimicrobiales bacterium]|nr:hypothetical protein [Acidimicrobiales bacterium]